LIEFPTKSPLKQGAPFCRLRARLEKKRLVYRCNRAQCTGCTFQLADSCMKTG
jgi:hypothetical protein